MSAAVENKSNLWRGLKTLGDGLSVPLGFDLDALLEQSERQRDELETLRQRATREAFALQPVG